MRRLAVGLVVTILSVVAFTQVVTAQDDPTPPPFGPAEEQWRIAEERTPYAFYEPTDLPSQTTRYRAIAWTNDAQANMVDLWYKLPEGGVIHVWQTNDNGYPESETAFHHDERADRVELSDGSKWYRIVVSDDRPKDRLILGRTMDDDITVQVSGPLEAESIVQRAAMSLQADSG